MDVQYRCNHLDRCPRMHLKLLIFANFPLQHKINSARMVLNINTKNSREPVSEFKVTQTSISHL